MAVTTKYPNTANCTARPARFLLYAKLETVFLACCLCVNILLVVTTVLSSKPVTASKDQPSNVVMFAIKIKPQLRTRMGYLSLLWILNTIYFLINLPHLYCALKRVSKRVENGWIFHIPASLGSDFRFQTLFFIFILISGAVATKAACYASIRGTPEDVSHFFVASFLFAALFGTTSPFLLQNIRRIHENMNLN
ncbi:unnamed protein product [Orchesella dallaii]|uniref:Uncharacterized protein n=1 Tax=Orchesella dallaii TaxID=48710 RepID=A0ABP1PLU2_9HEXA